MIFVKRGKAPPALNLDDPTSPAAKERQELIDLLTSSGSIPKGFEFKAYGAAREELTKLFHGKCAYCESKISGSSQTDIEHFRPKGSVEEAKKAGFDHPGYWWLAMVWENLTLSCMHCNQRRRQLILTPGATDEEIDEAIRRNKLRTTGKLDSFPTENSHWVTTHDDDLSSEKPILIDPTAIDPEPLFEWMTHGSLSTVRARNGNPRAQGSIEILGLNRRWLTEARIQTVNLLRKAKADMVDALNKMRRARSEEAAQNAHDEVLKHLETIRDHAKASQPFAALGRAYFREARAMLDDLT